MARTRLLRAVQPCPRTEFDWLKAPANLYVQRYVTAKGCPYSSSTRLVALAIASFMIGHDDCFPGVARVAARCNLSPRTVQRSMKVLLSGPTPLFKRSAPGGITRGHRHSTCKVELVRSSGGPPWMQSA